MIKDGQFGYPTVNVMNQRRNPESLLNWMERAIRMRKECPEFGWGKWEILETGNPQVMAHRCEWKKGIVYAVHNFSRQPCTVTLKGDRDQDCHFLELMGDCPYEPLAGASREIHLEGFGFRWFRAWNHR